MLLVTAKLVVLDGVQREQCPLCREASLTNQLCRNALEGVDVLMLAQARPPAYGACIVVDAGAVDGERRIVCYPTLWWRTAWRERSWPLELNFVLAYACLQCGDQRLEAVDALRERGGSS